MKTDSKFGNSKLVKVLLFLLCFKLDFVILVEPPCDPSLVHETVCRPRTNFRMSEHIIEDGKNRLGVECPHCNSRILNEKMGDYLKQEMQIPQPNCKEENFETLDEFWKVTPILSFENIGMTKPSASGTRYLTCSDCERGPLGIFDAPSDTAFIAIARVKHVEEKK